MAEDYYAVLGVSKRASADEIKKAYRRLTLELHPDRHPDDAHAQERFTLVNQAYDTLSDPTRRAKYDATKLRNDTLDLARSFEGRSPREIFSDVFGDVFGARREERRRGRDVRYTLTVSVRDVALGSSHDIEFEAPGECETCRGEGVRPGGRAPTACGNCEGKGEVKTGGLLGRRSRCGRCDGTGLLNVDPCETCRGRGTLRRQRAFSVRVPAGTEPGSERVVPGEGEPGRFGGEPGDLRVTINVRPDEDLRVKGTNIESEVPVTISEAALGAKIPVRCVDGVVEVDVPQGIEDGTRLRLRGKGVRRVDGSRGDQIVKVRIETPQVGKGGTAPVRKALSELQEVFEDDATAHPRRTAYRARLARDERD